MSNLIQTINEASERIKTLITLRDQQQQLIRDLSSQQQQLSLLLDTPQTAINYTNNQPRRVTVAPSTDKFLPSSKATKILSLIAQGYTTTKALAEKTQLSLTTVQMVTRDLRARGYIRNNGSERNEKKVVRQIPAHTIEIPCKPYVVYALTEKGQSRISQTPQATTSNNTPTTAQPPLIRDKVEAQRNGLRPRAQELLNLIKGGTTRATQLAKTMGISFESVSTELYILQRLGHIKLRGDYATRANAINRMSRHLVDRIAKPV